MGFLVWISVRIETFKADGAIGVIMSKDQNHRDLSLRILNRLSNNPAFSNQILKTYLDRCNLRDKDRAFVVNIIQGVIRWKLRLDWIIQQFLRFPFKKLDPDVLNILRIAIYQLYFMDRVPDFAIVNEAVRQAKRRGRHIASTVNGILRNICRNKNNISFPDRKKELVKFFSVYYSYPEWLVKKWLRELGYEQTEKLLEAGNRTPYLTIRVNTLKTDREKLIELLVQEGVKEVYPTKYSPVGIIIKGLQRPVTQLRAYKKGLFFVQDEASQLCAYILNPMPNDTILDVCAGLGTKSVHMAELIKKNGKIIALDIDPKRLLILAQTLRREGLEDFIYPVVGDGRKVFSIFKSHFDKILVDAPCSGLGTIMRHPDIKWVKTEQDIKMLSMIQKMLLYASAKILKKGGIMLYTTCTISKEENEMIVEEFLEDHPEIRQLNISSICAWLKDLEDKCGFFRTYPHIHKMDGFFGAVFCRII